jgi:hypothetical protein
MVASGRVASLAKRAADYGVETGSMDLTCWSRRGAPNTDVLNVSAAGIATDSAGFVTVNERLESVTILGNDLVQQRIRGIAMSSVSRRQWMELMAASSMCLASGCRRTTEAHRSLHRQGDVVDWSAGEMAKAIRERTLSSEELVATCLRRIAAGNPKLNAVVQVRREGALADARAADAAIKRGDTTGPLHGVPMTVKDSFDTAGVISTAGTKGRMSFVPDSDATAVARLKRAGAILLGKNQYTRVHAQLRNGQSCVWTNEQSISLKVRLAVGVDLRCPDDCAPEPWPLALYSSKRPSTQATQLLDMLPPLGRTMAGLAMLSGLRRAKLFALRWRHLDEEGRMLIVREAVYEGCFDTPNWRPVERASTTSFTHFDA